MYFNNEHFTNVINAFEAYDEVDCIALGGSRSTGECDEKSDFDVYVYCNGSLSAEKKRAAVEGNCSLTEIENHYWELEDNCILNDGIEMDIIYRSIDEFEKYLKFVIDGGNAYNGYTTCFWHNIINSKVLFDKSGKFTELQKEYTIPYPEELRKNIIERNRKLLSGILPSYDMQIKKAENRGDIVSVHHRTTEFLASYFDIIFALNKMTHPGEKRLVSLCKKHCKLLPANFEENISTLLKAVTNGGAYDKACEIVKELDKVLSENG